MTDKISIDRSTLEQALEAHQSLRAWIKAVPQATVLPAMPGMDGDWLDSVEGDLHVALEQPQAKQEPYFWYDNDNGDLWTPEAISDGYTTEGLIPLYTHLHQPSSLYLGLSKGESK